MPVSHNDFLERWNTIGNFILIGGSTFWISVFLYSFYHYSVSGERQFTAPIGMVTHYAVPVALATLLLVALRLKRTHKINLAILFVSVGISFCGAEVFLSFYDRVTSANRPIWGDEISKRKYEILALAKEFGVSFDARSKFEVLSDFRHKGTDAVPAVNPMLFLKKRDDGSLRSELEIHGLEILPLGGMSNQITVFCNETGEYLIYASDEHGFHNPKHIWLSNRVPIIALGDSFAAGGCVPSEKGFVALVRDHYPGTLNLAMAGEGALTMLATLREYAPAVKPRMVLWFYYEEGDIEELRREAQSPLLMRYMENGFSQNLLELQEPIDKAMLEYIDRSLVEQLSKENNDAKKKLDVTEQLLAIGKLATMRRKLGLVFGESSSEKRETSQTSEAGLELFESILLQAKTTVASWGGSLYFVYLPAWERYGNPQLAKRTGRYRDQVLASINRLRIPIIDLHPVFQSRPDPLSLFSFRRFGHYNEDGHRVVAEEVLRSLTTDK